MLTRNSSVHPAELLALAAEQFGVRAPAAEFVPRGEDSWAYRIGPLWVSVRRDLDGHHPAAYEAAWQLHQAGLEFVVAPLAGADGRVVHHVGGHPVVVFPHLDAVALPTSAADLDGHRSQVQDMVGLLHRSTVDADLPLPREDFTLPFAERMDRALRAATGEMPSRGPYGNAVREVVLRNHHALESVRRTVTEVGESCAGAGVAPVLTHGDPSPDNVIVHRGRLFVVDWGGLTWAPPERDWYNVARTFGSAPPGRDDVVDFYRIRRILSEITEYVGRFAHPHSGDADDQAMWRRLSHNIVLLQREVGAAVG
ncbi:phosphotransferase [Saccharopolyspora sp. NPDC000359]|uniref:phosphotransferase n=1 Tax=Saccharopolyspora sp. NPDC000359 TaxID=3154251 RepID=UPI003334845A